MYCDEHKDIDLDEKHCLYCDIKNLKTELAQMKLALELACREANSRGLIDGIVPSEFIFKSKVAKGAK